MTDDPWQITIPPTMNRGRGSGMENWPFALRHREGMGLICEIGMPKGMGLTNDGARAIAGAVLDGLNQSRHQGGQIMSALTKAFAEHLEGLLEFHREDHDDDQFSDPIERVSPVLPPEENDGLGALTITLASGKKLNIVVTESRE